MLPHRLFSAQTPAQFNMVLIHGMLEHGDRYQELAQFLAQHGGNVITFNLPGHGAGQVDAHALNHFGEQGLQSVFDGIHALFDQLDPSLPQVLFGHSMGASIALRYAQLHRSLQLLVLGSPPVKSGRLYHFAYHVALIEKRVKGVNHPSVMMRELVKYNHYFAPNRTAFDWLSVNPDNVDAYIADPLCGFAVDISYWEEMLDVMRMAFGREQLLSMDTTMPILVLWGANDPCTRFGRGPMRLLQFLRPHWQAEVASIEYPQLRHEILHEYSRHEVFADILKHINKHLNQAAKPTLTSE